MSGRPLKTGLAIILVLSVICICGCTSSPEVVNLDSPGPTASSNGQANSTDAVHHPTDTPRPSPTPTRYPSLYPTATPTPTPTPAHTPTPTPTVTPTPQKPAISYAKASQAEYPAAAGQAVLVVIVDSGSAIRGYSLSLDGPDGNVMNGTFWGPANNIANGQWRYDITFRTYATTTPGTYTWSQVRVISNDGVWSDYAPAASFKIVSSGNPIDNGSP